MITVKRNPIIPTTGIIGPAEDGLYTDGIFTDFHTGTTIGTAIDRFNEVLLKLAPPSPLSSWDNKFTSISITTGSYSGKPLNSVTPVSGIVSTTTPSFTTVNIIGTGQTSMSLPSGPNTISFSLTETQLGTLSSETEIINSGSTGNQIGLIKYNVGDPYAGLNGQKNFWTGITSMVIGGTLPTMTASGNQQTLSLLYPGSDSPKSVNFYIDNPITPSISNLIATLPNMTKKISGVPSLYSGQTITNIGFTASNAVSFFYNSSQLYTISGTFINSTSGNPDSAPTISGQTLTKSGLSTTVTNSTIGIYNDNSFTFNVTIYNSNGGSSISGYTSYTHRIDAVSVESNRLVSGSGISPSSGYGGVYDSNISLVDTYTEELQLKNNIYQYPTLNYTSYGGPNYSTATGLRWVTFNKGSFGDINNKKNAFTLNILGSNNIPTLDTNNFYLEVKIEGVGGTSKWANAHSFFTPGTLPGVGTNGIGCVDTGYSGNSNILRRIVFGTSLYYGDIIVRVGWDTSLSPQPSFTNVSITNIP